MDGSKGTMRASVSSTAKPGLHRMSLKQSPTLLFDILAETDKAKQQAKLLGATLRSPAKATADLAGGTAGSGVGAAQQQHNTPAISTASGSTGSGERGSVTPPATPDPGTEAGSPTASGSAVDSVASSLTAVTGGAGPPPAMTAAVAATASASGGGTSSCASLGLPAATGGQEAAFAALSLSAVGESGTAATAAASAGDRDAGTRRAPPSAAPGGGAAASPPVDPATQAPAAAASSVPAPDPLAEFTPRVILQELLGELFLPPERLSPVGKFGQGAFATVQSCSLDDPGGGPSRLVAVKSLKPEVLSDLEDLRRFLLEANLVRKLRHPHVVSLVGLGGWLLSDLDSLRRSAFVAMEALEGGDLRMMVLRQMTSHRPAYSRLDALRWCAHIASACAYLHHTCRPMVIHRDLKLENVLLTGGPVDGRVAKITDFGLHKRARASASSADVLIAVTNEWSTRAGSVYRGGCCAGGGGEGMAAGGSGRAERSCYGGNAYKDISYYGGTVYAGNAFGGASVHRGASNHAAAADRSSSAHYAALAAAGMAAAAATAAADLARLTSGGCSAAGTADGAATDGGDGSVAGGGGGSCHGAGSSLPGGSLRAGSEAAAELGIAGHGVAGERERPYLLAYDKRYDAHLTRSKLNSTNDLVGMHEAALAAASGAGGGAAPAVATSFGLPALQQAAARLGGGTASATDGASGDGGAFHSLAPPHPPHPPASPPLPAPASWSPPHTVPTSLEESVHRKMLALMALESAAAAAAGTGTAAAATASARDGAGTSANAGSGPNSAAAAADGNGNTAAAPFSVTEFVRAAAAVPVEGAGPGGPSAVMLMRSMSLALQQQKEQQQQQPEPCGGSVHAPAAAPPPSLSFAAPPPPPRAAARAAMKTVPEDIRMSMDLGSAGHLRLGSHKAGGLSQSSAFSAAPSGPGSKRAREGERECAVSAAARMADATRQVGSLIYMAPELVLSGSYNEKVDVFSFAIMAYELFTGKLLAIKIANEYAYQQAQSRPGAPPGPTGPGGLPAAATASGECGGDGGAEAGVMSYVMRRSGGAREPLPAWWPARLRSLISACWAQDPADRPSFLEVHSELVALLEGGLLADMDAKDPARAPGCGCCVS